MEQLTLKELNIFENTKPLWIERITIQKKVMELCIPFETSFGRFNSLTRLFPVIDFRTGEGEIIRGIGECSPLSGPWYDYECHRSVETALLYISSALTGKPVDEVDGIAAKNITPITDINLLIKKYKWIVGHNIAKAGVEGAYWDALAKINNLPMYKLWGGTRNFVEAGTSVGLEASPEALIKKVDIAVNELKAARIKVKVKPGSDISYIEAIRKKYPEIKLMADANASYDLFNSDHISRLKEFDNYNLMMIEQPGPNDDIIDHSKQLAILNTPVCLDESILHATHARQAIELWRQYSSTNKLIINIKPPRVGGYYEAIKIAYLCKKNGVSVWCGGMLESALGKAANVHFASREEVNLPGDHISQAPYFTENVAEQLPYSDGKITVPNETGWGLQSLSIGTSIK